MDIYTLDFETYYDTEYSLSKMTTEEYVRDSRFEALILGYKKNDEPALSVVGAEKIAAALANMRLEHNAVLAHHAHFDGLILFHHFGHSPKYWLDTLSMGRALHGVSVGGSLAKLALHYDLGEKGNEVLYAKGKHLADFTQEELIRYRTYCKFDVELTYKLFRAMAKEFPKGELPIVDMVVRMFTEPQILLDDIMLNGYLEELRTDKTMLLLEAGVQLDEVMSAEKFADALKRLGVAPPVKVSPRTGKLTYAFAKTDRAMEGLAEHPDVAVQALVAARLGSKSTANETRAERLVSMAGRGHACVYLRYSGAAQTHRLSGGDGSNWQNFQRGGVLRKAVVAPPGYMFVVVDSANIESRVLDWLAGQNNALETYRKFDAGEGPDIYCVLASAIYGRDITPEDKDERQLGKVAKLGLGYQMGPTKFTDTARLWGVAIDPTFAQRVVAVYRRGHPMVQVLWDRASSALQELAANRSESDKFVDTKQLIRIKKESLLLPNGLHIRYPQLRYDSDTNWTFQAGRERTRIYGGKIIENVVQALARIIVLGQTLRLSRKYRVVLSVHDEAVLLVPVSEVENAREYAEHVFSSPPMWCLDLPLSAKAGFAARYGDAK